MAVFEPPRLTRFTNWVGEFEVWEGIFYCLAALVAGRLGPRLARWKGLPRIEGALDRLSSRPPRTIAACGLISLAGCFAVGILLKYPEPVVHDEFSYLLAADTFASGRLSNPTHPKWEHFETMHVIHRPTYMSKYPPGQGAVLALGLKLGDPILGVWLTTALACAAVCWMLYGWLPPRWAAWGGLLSTIRFGIGGYFAQSFWGGSLAVLGGALIYGALARLWKRPSVLQALVLGAGLCLLANTRPFEGMVAALPVAAALAWRFSRPGDVPRLAWAARVGAPLVAMLGLTAWMVTTYNRAVTGEALKFPHFVHQEQYALISQFLWGKAPAAHPYNHKVMQEFFEGEELPFLTRQKATGRLLLESIWKMRRATQFPYGALFVIPLLALPVVLRRRPMKFAAGAFAVLLLGCGMLTLVLAHYAAPGVAVGFLLLTQSIRVFRAGGPGGRLFGLLLIPLVFAMMTWGVIVWSRGGLHEWGTVRAHYQEEFESMPGKHLVIVRYGPSHVSHFEWVYNRADIDGSRVVWAREMDPERNASLIRCFGDRTPWLFVVDKADEPPKRSPYPR
jgi:hypothetical protein